MSYWTNLFPYLIPHVYSIIKKSAKSDFINFFEEPKIPKKNQLTESNISEKELSLDFSKGDGSFIDFSEVRGKYEDLTIYRIDVKFLKDKDQFFKYIKSNCQYVRHLELMFSIFEKTFLLKLLKLLPNLESIYFLAIFINMRTKIMTCDLPKFENLKKLSIEDGLEMFCVFENVTSLKEITCNDNGFIVPTSDSPLFKTINQQKKLKILDINCQNLGQMFHIEQPVNFQLDELKMGIVPSFVFSRRILDFLKTQKNLKIVDIKFPKADDRKEYLNHVLFLDTLENFDLLIEESDYEFLINLCILNNSMNFLKLSGIVDKSILRKVELMFPKIFSLDLKLDCDDEGKVENLEQMNFADLKCLSIQIKRFQGEKVLSNCTSIISMIENLNLKNISFLYVNIDAWCNNKLLKVLEKVFNQNSQLEHFGIKAHCCTMHQY